MDPENVRELVHAANNGDSSAWKLLVEHFSGLIWSVARGFGLNHADAGDVLQTTWLRLAEHLGRIENPERVGAWLATTARHEAVTRTRSKCSSFTLPAPITGTLPGASRKGSRAGKRTWNRPPGARRWRRPASLPVP